MKTSFCFISALLLLVAGCREQQAPNIVEPARKAPGSLLKTPFNHERISYTVTTRVISDAPVVLGLDGEFQSMSSQSILASTEGIDEECYIEGTVENGDEYTLYIEKRRGIGSQVRQMFGPSALNIDPTLESEEVHSVTYNKGELIFKNAAGSEVGRQTIGNVVDSMEIKTGLIPHYPLQELPPEGKVTADFFRSLGKPVVEIEGGNFSVTESVFGNELVTIFEGSTGNVLRSTIRQGSQPVMEVTFEYGEANGASYISRQENTRYDYFDNRVVTTRSTTSISNFSAERY